MKVTWERLGLEQPKFPNVGTKVNMEILPFLLWGPPVSFRDYLGQCLVSKLGSWRITTFCNFGTHPSLESFTYSLAPFLTPLIMLALSFSKIFFTNGASTWRIGHKWRKGWSWWYQKIEAEDRIISVNQVCYEPAKMLQDWQLPATPEIFVMDPPHSCEVTILPCHGTPYNVLSPIESACRHACLCVRTYIHAYAQQWVFANEAWQFIFAGMPGQATFEVDHCSWQCASTGTTTGSYTAVWATVWPGLGFTVRGR